MQVTIAAVDLTVDAAGIYSSYASDHNYNNLHLIGSPTERVSLLCEWLGVEMDANDLSQCEESKRALIAMLAKAEKSLKASDIPKPK